MHTHAQLSSSPDLPSEMHEQIISHLPLEDMLSWRLVDRCLKRIADDCLLKELKIKEIACGMFHSVILLQNGRVLVMGSNSNGQIGLGKEIKKVHLPREICGIAKISHIEAGDLCTFLLTESKDILVMGSNRGECLGFGAQENIFYPSLMPGIHDAKSISHAGRTTAVLFEKEPEKDEIELLGDAAYLSALRTGNTVKLHCKALVPPDGLVLKDIVAVRSHALILTDKGRVYGRGSSQYGYLGTMTPWIEPWTRLLRGTKAKKIVATERGSLILTTDHRLMVSGLDYGQFGLKKLLKDSYEENIVSPFQPVPIEKKKIIDIAANTTTTLVLTKRNNLFAMGNNHEGQLGHPNKEMHRVSELTVVAGFFKLRHRLKKKKVSSAAVSTPYRSL